MYILLLNCTPHTVCEIFEAIFKVKFQNNRLAENPVYSARIYTYIKYNSKNISFLKNNRIKLRSNALKYHIKVSDE